MQRIFLFSYPFELAHVALATMKRTVFTHKSLYFFIVINFKVYTIPAVFVVSKRNHPNIHHDGYTYGRQPKRNPDLWYCTFARCSATIQTKKINGHDMMRLKNPNHICVRRLNLPDMPPVEFKDRRDQKFT